MTQGLEEIRELLTLNRLCEAQLLVQQYLKHSPNNQELKEYYGLILNRSGATQKALELITPLYYTTNPSLSICGLMGRIYKNLWSSSDENKFAINSAQVYEQGFNSHNSYYLGINAATMYLIGENQTLSQNIAKKTIDLCKKEKQEYWVLATLTEAYLLLGDLDNSLISAIAAINTEIANIGSINSTYQQLKILEEYVEIPSEIIDLFFPPGIVAFSGHMIDKSGSLEQQFPPEIENEINLEINIQLDLINAQIGYSSAACGSDILFIESMLQRKAEIHIILPFSKSDFIKTSVKHAGANWEARFENILLKATSVKYATEQPYFGEQNLFEYTNQLIQGQCLLKAEMFQSSPFFINVISGGSKQQTIEEYPHFLNQLSDQDNTIIIDTKPFIQNKKATNKTAKTVSAKYFDNVFPIGMSREVKSMLFADVVGFSKIKEQQKPYFLNEFMNELSKNINNLDFKPQVLNTWGDAIFFVGENTKQAAEFAFMLSDMVLKTNWEEKNLPSNLNIRIALHSGPIFIGVDPVLNRMNAYGEHVNRAARIEPVTIPGQVYASDQFAASLKVETKNHYSYEFIGNLELPKAFGSQDLYHLRENNHKKRKLSNCFTLL